MIFKNIYFKHVLYLFISVFLIVIIFQSIFLNKSTEGFNVNDIDNMFDSVKGITKSVNAIPNEINKIGTKLETQTNKLGKEIEDKTQKMGKQIEEKTKKMGEEIEAKTINVLVVKLKSIFTQLGDIFNDSIISPIITLFNNIGNIFIQIFGILQEIGNKIVSLPGCLLTYAITETLNTFFYFYRTILPKFIRDIFTNIYNFTFKYVFNFIGSISGYDKSYDRCYGFNISNEVNKINSNLTNINAAFKKDFGNLDFSKIKV
jgi:predicted PurR-regulated permease PerM